MVYKLCDCSMKLIHSLFRFVNMKTILAVIFLGIVTFAFADYPTLSACKHPPAMEGFNLDRFMKGTWYVTNAKHGSNSTVCREYSSKKEDGQQVLVLDGYYSFGKSLKIYLTVSCKKLRDENGKFIFNCTRKGPVAGNDKMNFDFQLEITILSTDYDKSAIMYRCVKLPELLGGRFEDNVLVLHRDAGNTDDKDLEDTLKKQEWSLESFISRKGVTCPSPPKNTKI